MRKAHHLLALVGTLGSTALLAAGCIDFVAEYYTPLTNPDLLDGGHEGGPPPACIPSMSSTPVAASCGVFVSSEGGDDTNGKGTPTAPYKTIGKALAANASIVYACAGTAPYAEALTVSKAVSLFGGLDCGTWAYSAATKTQLAGPSDAVPLTLASTASGSAVEDFAITAVDATKAGGSSIALIADGVTASLTRVEIAAGNGKDGLAGTTPTVSVGPTNPSDPTIVGVAGQNACMATSQQFGGASVTNPMCNSIGGAGGIGEVSNGSNGDVNPATPQTALGGVGQPNVDPSNTWSCASGNGGGTTGSNGTNGTPGTGAKSTDLGTLDANSGYTGVAGQPGGSGSPGQGGGGGGGAKGKTMCAGASGGSGGAGGCGGNGGTGGAAGGASIGIVSLGATLAFDTVSISVGDGGKGGDGGGGEVGGVGGNGGQGGLGNNAGQNLSSACSGGAGGPGGTGGMGGGGRGGHVIAIAYTGATAPLMTGVSFPSTGTAGQGGMGDSSMGNMGNGAAGDAANVQGF